jgi:hypothetical protein
MTSIGTGKLLKRDTPRFLDAFELVLRRDWSGRFWIAQELTLVPHDPLVLCGQHSVFWSKFVASTRYVRAIFYPSIKHIVSSLEEPAALSQEDLSLAFS